MKRVLVVDDHEENLYLLQVLLENNGSTVELARNGAEALEKARKNPPDLIVSDILMPVMDGFTLCENLKADELLSRIPFVFYTATYTDPMDEQLALSLGADAFITRPAEPEDFLATIFAVLAKAEAGGPVSLAEPEDEDGTILKQYNEVLIRKLERKMLQLEEANQALEREAAERRGAEETLRLVRYSVDHVADSVFCTDSQGRIVFAGESTGKTLGYKPDELLALTLFDLDPTLSPDLWARTWQRLKEEGGFAFETVHRTKAGKNFPVDVSENYVAFEDKELNFVFARDISDGLRTETALRRQLALDEIVQDVLSQIVSVAAAELDGVIQNALEPIAAFMGVDSAIIFQVTEDITRWSATYGWAAPGIQSLRQRLQDIPMGTLAWAEGELLAGHTVVLRSSRDLPPEADSLRELWREQGVRSALMVPLRGRGAQVKGSLALFAVASELAWDYPMVRQAEQAGEGFASALSRKTVEESLRTSDERLRQSQKMEAIGQLAGGIAHDFNNLLTAIIGYSDLLITSSDPMQTPPDLVRSVQEIRKAAQRAAELTAQILAFSRRQALRPQVISLNDAIDEIRSLVQRTLGEDIEIIFDLDPEVGTCEVDPHQLVSVLMNLAVNARDAMPRGGRLTVQTANAELDEEHCCRQDDCPPGSYVVLAVTDTGSGMDKQTQTRIFEPFFTTKEPGRGTGLGLSTVHGIVKQSGGGVFVYSEQGKGTTFKIYLPRSEKAARPAVAPPAHGRVSDGGEAILVVENEEALRFLLRRALEAAHYKVLIAADADEALAMLHGQDPIDLLLTDLTLPGDVQGNTLSREALACRPGLAVVYMSGYSRSAVAQDAGIHNDVGFLEKPFTTGTLARKVREALEARPLAPTE